MTIQQALAKSFAGVTVYGALRGRSLHAWALLGVLMLFCIFAVMDRIVIAMLVDPIRRDLGLNDTQIALLMGLAYASAYALGGLPMGYIVDRLSRKWLLFAAVIFWGLAEAGCGLASGFAVLFLARMGVGFGESPLHPSAHSIIADTFHKRRLATAMSIYSTGNLLGTGVGLMVGGLIVSALMRRSGVELPVVGTVKPWQFAFIVTGLPCVVLALLLLPFREPTRNAYHRWRDNSWEELGRFVSARWRVLLSLSMVFGGMNIVNGALIKWAPSYLGRYFHLDPARYGLALGGIDVVAGVAGLLLSGWLADRWYASGRKDAHLRYYAGVLLITSPFVFYGLRSPNVWICLAAIALAKFATVNFLGLAAALVQLISPPRLRGRLSAIFFLMIIGLLGTSVGPLAPALISDYVLHDEVHMGHAIAATLAIFAPLAFAAIVWGRGPLHAAIDAAETWI